MGTSVYCLMNKNEGPFCGLSIHALSEIVYTLLLGYGTVCIHTRETYTNICILANVCLLSNFLCACLSTYLSLGLRAALQKTLVKQSSLDNDPFENTNGEDNIFNDVDGNARQSSDDDMPPTPPRPATPTITQQRTLPWKPKVR